MNRYSKQSLRGFSMIEMMVGVVISMLAILVIFEAFAVFEGQRRTTTSATAAQESGLLALSAIDRDARMAGYGMVVNNMLACASVNVFQNGAAGTIPFLPIAITDGGGAANDSITVMYSTSPFAPTPALLSVDSPASAPVVSVSNTASNAVFKTGDFFLVAQPTLGKPCSRLRVTGTTMVAADVQLAHASSDPMNPPVATNIFPTLPTPGYTASATDQSVVINMGAMTRSTYSIVNRSLAYTDETRATAPVALSAGIVSLQAQYGIAAAGTQTVNEWVDAKSAQWATPSAVDIPRIKAIRIAIIARSPILEKGNVTPICVNNAGNNKGPCAWQDTASSPAPLIDLSADPDWQRYRYRVYETIVPLRNVLWGNV